MKHSDRPISRPSQDLLGRSKFSLALARSIDNLNLARDGFVIAVIGKWGSGKSSVIEMALRYLTHLEMLRLASDAETLDTLEMLAEIFDDVSDRVVAYQTSELNFSKAARAYRISRFTEWLASDDLGAKADKYWNLLQLVDANCKTIQVRFSPWLISGRAELATALLSDLARAVETLGPDIKQAFASLLQRLSEFAPLTGAGVDLATGTGIGKFISAGGSWSGKLASKMTSGPTLDQLRERLRTLLRALQDQRILVIIDDLDRLTPQEASEMVSLVKSLGDLPNVIYLLSYDSENLENLIEAATTLDGHEYLQKIVQYPVHIPPAPKNGLSKILDAELSLFLGDLDEEDTIRIGYTWYYVLRHYITTPRDIRLFCNSIGVSIASLRNYVDPIDLIILELLRLHEPEIYNWIKENLGELTE